MQRCIRVTCSPRNCQMTVCLGRIIGYWINRDKSDL
uniref:Uncharacterized protein n=1 Tax=Anopheles arabiensis TaxID=7173 RepID=A0A182IHE1_ANOAR